MTYSGTLGTFGRPVLVACALWLTSACGGSSRASLPPKLYPEPPAQPRLQLLASYTSEQDVTGKQSGFDKFLVGEKDTKSIGKAYGLAIHDGRIFVCDASAGFVWILDVKRKSIARLGDKSPGRLAHPVNISIDRDGTRYIADTDHRRVMVYNADNRFLRALGTADTWRPVDVVVKDEKLIALDVAQAQVVLLDKQSGKELGRFSSKGSGPGQLFHPTNLATDTEGNIYVGDTTNFRVQKFSPTGEVMLQIGQLGKRPGDFARPRGVAVDREGRVYVVDAAFQNVQIFDAAGKLLLFFGGPGKQRGDLNLPAKIIIDYDNVGVFADKVVPGYDVDYLVLVTSQYGANKVNVFGFLKQKSAAEGAR